MYISQKVSLEMKEAIVFLIKPDPMLPLSGTPSLVY